MGNETSSTNQKLNLSLDLRIVCAVLLLVIIGMLAAWRPWVASTSSKDRTISVSGEATLKATPDEYVFYPTYEFENDDRAAGLKELTTKSEELIKELKKLGIAENKIKSDTNSYDSHLYSMGTGGTPTATLQLTVTVNDKDKVQKVQDYLVSTAPSGSISPQASFSTAKRKALESTARGKATTDARAKADESAKTLGFKISGVKSVTDSSQGGGIIAYEGAATAMTVDSGAGSKASSLLVNPGQNELNYTVTVVYYIR